MRPSIAPWKTYLLQHRGIDFIDLEWPHELKQAGMVPVFPVSAYGTDQVYLNTGEFYQTLGC